MELTFRIAKLLDYAGDLAGLEANDSPFEPVVAAHLEAMATRKDPETRRASKLRLIKNLYRKNLTKEDVGRLFGLIDWMMTLPDDLEEVLRAEVHEFQEENQMPYMNMFERYGYKKGREEGREEGERIGLLEGIALALNAKFGAAGRRLEKKVCALKHLSEVREFAELLKSANSVDDLRSFFH